MLRKFRKPYYFSGLLYDLFFKKYMAARSKQSQNIENGVRILKKNCIAYVEIE